MRVGHLNVTRPMWWDRGPTVVGKMATSNGPIVLTVIWTYTVPTGKKAYCDMLEAVVYRGNAPGAVGEATSLIDMYDATSTFVARLLNTRVYSATPLDRSQDFIAAYGVLTEGFSVLGQYSDASTGGTTTMRSGGKFTEFNA